MGKDDVLRLRIDSDVRDDINERAENSGITASEWVRTAIDYYLEHEGDELPSLEEVNDMDWNDLAKLIEKLELEIEPDDYDNSKFLGSPDEDDIEDLREAIIDELGLSDDDEETNQEEEE